jgi:excisionase family DNA binding protein
VPAHTKRKLVSIPHAAEYAAVSNDTIRRRIASGHLTGYRLGTRIIRVDLDEVDGLLKTIPTTRPNGGGQAA